MSLSLQTTHLKVLICVGLVYIYHSLGKFSRRQIHGIFLIFPRKQDLTFYANCLQNLSGKNKKTISVCRLLIVLPSMPSMITPGRLWLLLLLLFIYVSLRSNLFKPDTHHRNSWQTFDRYAFNVICTIPNGYAGEFSPITKTRLFKYTENFTTKKWKFLDKKFWYFSYFCSKHRLWVLIRTASARWF